MKRLLLSTLILCSIMATAQDTTTSRLVILGTFPADIYFTPDTGLDAFATVQVGSMAPGSSGHGIFENPSDGKLYAVADSGTGLSRAIYEVNPLSGASSLVYDFGDLVSSVEVTDDGRIFAIHGNGGSTPGAVYEVDLANQSDSMVFQSSVASFQPRALGFNPMTDELYVVSGFNDSIFIYELNTWAESIGTGSLGEEIHGCYYRNDSLHVVAYGGHHAVIDLSAGYSAGTWEYDRFPHAMDLCEVTLVQEESGVVLCDGEFLHAKYEAEAYAWYKDGVMIPGSDSMAVAVDGAGTYHLITQIKDTAAYVRSEGVAVTIEPSPVVTITPASAGLCEDDSVLLEGTMGSTYQWYLNGVAIVGATSNIYYAQEAGLYNLMVTNAAGCSDTAAMGTQVDSLPLDSCLPTGVMGIEDRFSVYPNPSTDVVVISGNADISNVQILNIDGTVVLQTPVLNSERVELSTLEMTPGTYFIRIANDDGVITKPFLKL